MNTESPRLIGTTLVVAAFAIAAVTLAPVPAAGQSGFDFNCNNVTTNCSGHASSVGGGYFNPSGQPVCNCSCTKAWTGERCRTCPIGYNPDDDCGSCQSPQYVGYPNCTSDTCTKAGDCNDHAKSVVGYRSTGCNCTCINAYEGATCDDCPPNFWNGDGFCGSCATGFDPSSYPSCYQECSIEFNCSDHASNVQGNVVQGCQCTCIPGWEGDKCETCPVRFAGSNCNRCAPGYSTFPFCVPCTTQQNCSGRARTANYDPQTGSCTCIDCRNQWSGSSCETCPVEYDPNTDCSTCNTPAGFGGNYPDCDRECTNANACNGNARTWSGTFRSGCVCTCKNEWSGGACAICPSKFDSTQDCNACAADRIDDFPSCPPKPTTLPPPTTTALETTTLPPPTTTGPGGITPTPFAPPSPPNATNGSTPLPTPSSGPDPAPTNEQPTNEQPSKSQPEQPSHTKLPTDTVQATGTHTISVSHNITGSESWSENLTASVSMTQTGCPNSTYECLLYNNTENAPPENCQCTCKNQWSTATCIYCHPRYDEERGDCGNCSANHHFYPTCDYGMFIFGNYTPYWSDPALIDALLKADLMRALADDLTSFVNNLTCNNATNVTAYITGYDAPRDWFHFDIDVLSAQASTVFIAGQCIIRALETHYVVPMNVTRLLTEQLYPGQNVTVLLRNTSALNFTEESPCEGWCETAAAPVDLPATDEDAFPIWIVIVALAVLALIVGACLLRKRYLDVTNAKMDRNGLTERKIGGDEYSLLEEEMRDQDVLPGGKVAANSDRVGSAVRRRPNAPVIIPQNEI